MRPAFYRPNAPWLATGLLLALGSSFGQTFFLSLFAGEIRGEFGLSDGQWGGIYTAATLGSATVLVQAGRLADTMALRRLAVGILLLYAGAMLAMASAASVWLLGLAVFGLRFCGQGMLSHLAMTAMARWFRANRGRAVAVAVLGYPIGEALLPPLTVPLVAAVGWRGGWLIAAGIVLVVLLPVVLRLMADPRTPQGEGPDETAAGLGGRHWTRGQVLGHWGFWALMPGILAPSFIGTVAFFHQVHIAETRGWDLAVMTLGYPVYAGVSVATSLAFGRVVDRVGPLRLLPVYLLPMAAGMVLIQMPGSEVIWMGVLLCIGLTQGIAVTIIGTLWPTLYGTRHIGGVKALATSAMVVATAAGPGITGLAIDLGVPFPDQGMAMAAWLVAVSGLFAVVGARLAREVRVPATS
ncbi:MAG: MFS transporter [Thermohalobaculum sp.]|nr:MFS transporter [Thermohalobaculum sp.]